MLKAAFHNLGCKVNTYEFQIMQQSMEKAGYEIVPFSEKADIYIVNTCSVTNIADRKSRQMLHKAKKLNPQAIVVAVGCYAQTDTELSGRDETVDIIVGNNHKSDIVGIIEGYLKDHSQDRVVEDLGKEPEYEQGALCYSSERTRVDIKIQDGCNQFCTYCIIPYARGRIRSRDLEDIVKEVETLALGGYKEMVLTGIHLSSYGLDRHKDAEGKTPSYNSLADKGEYTNRDLLEVIDRVSDIPSIERIRLGSLEPRVITEEFLKRISDNPKVCPHFHLSLQSGCDETLKRMNRHYTTQDYLHRVEMIRSYYEHPAITTDIIVGFPGETEEEFEKTAAYLDEVRFYETHLFKYSKRKGTVAANMDGQLTDAVKAERSDVLSVKNELYSRRFREELIGKNVTVLTEESRMIKGKLYTLGHTADYVYAAVPGELEDNQFVTAVAEGFLENDILLLKKEG